MAVPPRVAEFLAGKRLAVAGVSRDPRQAANAIYRKLRAEGYEVFPVNPRATEVEGVRCYAGMEAIPGPVDGLIVASPPATALELVRRCADLGVPRIWFHRSLGGGSVSPAAVRECEVRGLSCIVGGCPLMYCGSPDPFHRCLRWVLRWSGRVPG
ncbi:CoA-binding protein [bacterium]|nr:CoA-binding protein [bacterium]